MFTPVGAPDGTEETIATTHFEPTDARRAFPCFDEPDLKAVFSITVDVPEGLGVCSNWSVVSEEPLESGGKARRLRRHHGHVDVPGCRRGRSPPSDCHPVEVDGTPITVVHVRGKEHLTRFALEAAAHSVRFFTEWFEIPYPGSKLDLVALPDFAMGAMENLGCVTFRESALLVDHDHASIAELAASVPGGRARDRPHVVRGSRHHALVGRDLAERGLRHAHGDPVRRRLPTRLGHLDCLRHHARAAQWQSTPSTRTRPVEFPVGKPEEAEAMFDPLTYEKGAGVLRMLERYIGAEQFREGIRLYLKRHSYGNTDSADLWAAIEESSGEPVGRIMDSWLHQGGFPFVQVQFQQRPDLGASAVALTQEPFMFSPELAGDRRHRSAVDGSDTVANSRRRQDRWRLEGHRPSRGPARERRARRRARWKRTRGRERRRIGCLPGPVPHRASDDARLTIGDLTLSSASTSSPTHGPPFSRTGPSSADFLSLAERLAQSLRQSATQTCGARSPDP